MKFNNEFRKAKPETIGETDSEFDMQNYAEWLESEFEKLKLLCVSGSLPSHDEVNKYKMKLSPRKARSDQFEELNSDNKGTENYWILLNEDYVTIAEQTMGEECKQEIRIEKTQFGKLIDWYNREQKCVKK